MKSETQSIYVATITSPERINNADMHAEVVRLVGDDPIWAVQVSERAWNKLCAGSERVAARFAVRRSASGNRVVALILQLDGLQLRSLIGLGNLLFRDILLVARRDGYIRMVFGKVDGPASGVFRCPVVTEDVRHLLDEYETNQGPCCATRIADLAIAAADLRSLTAMDTNFIDLEVEAAEVSMVMDGEAIEVGGQTQLASDSREQRSDSDAQATAIH